jgi:hypothetical protein
MCPTSLITICRSGRSETKSDWRLRILLQKQSVAFDGSASGCSRLPRCLVMTHTLLQAKMVALKLMSLLSLSITIGSSLLEMIITGGF